MKFSCLQENLSRALTVVRRAVSNRTATLPVTQNVLITAENSMVSISATDLKIAMTMVIGANVEEEGAVTVPARLLSDFVNSLPPERIDVVETNAPIGVNIKCLSFEANISGTKADDFPPIPAVEDGHTAKVAPDVLRDAINRVAFAAANDETRPVLTGVKAEISGSQMKLAAADGFRLAVYDVPLSEDVAEDFEFLIPARDLTEMSRLLGSQEEDVEFMVTTSSNQALFKVGDVEIVSSLLAGNFPSYDKLIPSTHTSRAIVRAEDFMQATRTASIFARDSSGIIRLHMSSVGDNGAGKLVVSARSEEVGDNEGEVQVAFEGEKAKIAFNARYLTDALDVLGGDIAVEVSGPSSPGVVKPAEEEDYTVVIMPMFVQW